MSSAAEQRLTPQEYLEIERRAEYKSEFLHGRIFAMAGASRAHNLITANLTGELRSQLKNQPCETYPSDMRVKVSRTGLYTYPDVVVVCGEPSFEDSETDTLLNPQVIFEVLSPSTEAYDRGEKFDHYRRLESVTDYVLVAQDKCRVEHYARQSGGQWLLSVAGDLRESLAVPSLSCSIPLAEIYARVSFESPDDAAPRPAAKTV
jgi:Uma2 family endonuclease